MGLDLSIARIVRGLLQAETFEVASTLVLREMLGTIEKELHGGPCQDAVLLRGMLHLRDRDGYSGLVVLPYDPLESLQPHKNEPGLFPSATTWRWLKKQSAPIAIDVELGAIRALKARSDQPLPERFPEHTAGSTPFDSKGSQERLLRRNTTHLLALPVRVQKGAIQGLFSFEVHCPRATGQIFPWPNILTALQLLADIASPYLLARPPDAKHTPGESPLLPVVGARMAKLVPVLRQFAQQDETLLFLGASGVGKSRLARWVHQQSPRRDGPFEVVDLSSIPEGSRLAELFGWKKGSFTSAIRDQKGYIAEAEGGTLVIDEIDKLPLDAQAGLLKLFETHEYRSLGDSKTHKSNLRFIVCTNADLQKAVEEGVFREDLYYRINVLPIKIPGLAERLDEIPGWASFMLREMSGSSQTEGPVSLSEEASALLGRQSWPGNLRQFHNVLRRAYAILRTEPSSHEITESHVERALRLGYGKEPAAPLQKLLEEAAEAFVEEAVKRSARGQALRLEQANAFCGLVLQAAYKRFPDLAALFRVFGEDALIQNRNHTREYKRQVSKAEDLRENLRGGQKE